jgi:hypothetical protein
VNLCERFLDIHVWESNGGNYALETLIFKWQAFPGSSDIGSIGKSRLGNRQTRVLDVNSRYVI